MKTLTGVIALVLALMFGTSSGVIAAEQKSQPTGGERKGQPGQDPLYPRSPKLVTGELTGKVTGVNPMAKTFNVMVQGRAITVSAARLSKLPTVGENIYITFALEPAGLPMATSTTEAGSTARPHIGGKQHCYHPLIPRPNPLISLNVCKY